VPAAWCWTPRIGESFVQWRPEDGDRTLGVVDFSIFPHVGLFPTNTMAAAEEWAAGLGNPAYALDEQSAVVVDGDRVEVVSEGEWRQFA
jgi:dipeptidase E